MARLLTEPRGAMPEEERVERRSMVGAPPSAKRPIKAPVTSSRPPRSAKRPKREIESDDDQESGSEKPIDSDTGDLEESAEDGEDEPATPSNSKKAPRKKRRAPLTDYHLKKKKILARKAAREAEKAEEKEKEKSATPEKEKTPEPVMKVPSLTKYSPIQLMCDHLLRKLMSKDPEEYFAFPVTPSMAPDYHTVIASPMDFSTMRQKIEDDKYSTIPEMKTDCELIVNNAMSYNPPNTVYHLAASRLVSIVKYYYSEQYLRFIFHTLPFANRIPLEKAGLAPLSRVPSKPENARKAAISDGMTAEICLNSADPKIREKLTPRKPKAKMGFLSNKDGATVLNVISDEGDAPDGEQKILKMGDIVGTLEEGNPGMITMSDHRLSMQTPLTYLNYGPFCSFAPQYDSTWSTLSKRDSDLLMRTYGDRANISDAFALRNLVSFDTGTHFLKVVDDLLDTLTDGEHSRTMKQLEDKEKEIKQDDPDPVDIWSLMDEVKSLENLGIDVSFVDDFKKQANAPKEEPQDIQSQLNHTGQAIVDLASLQHQRLSMAPPITLSKVPGPGPLETRLAGQIQQQLVQQVAAHAVPADLVGAPALHQAMAVQDDLDMDLLGEFFVT